MPLSTYRRKRRFSRTPEPRGRSRGRAHRAARSRLFVVQRHQASHLHYDFRLELGGSLKSWAVPKGPSLDPGQKRLAVHVEDHPIEYGRFEGDIPAGEYGAGSVVLWDRGRWVPEGDPAAGYEKGHLSFRLEGEKLRGLWSLVAMEGKGGDGKNWLLIKRPDPEARPGSGAGILVERPESVASSRGKPGAADRRKGGRGRGRLEPARLPGAKRGPLPERVEPQLAALAARVPEGGEWLHEIKFDGYRLLTRLHDGRAFLASRRGNDWTARAPEVASALESLAAREAVIDGELVVLDEKGRSSFQALQNHFTEGGSGSLVYYAFDLLHLDGWDLRDAPLSERKALLAALLGRGGRKGADLSRTLRYSEHVDGRGPELFRRACALALEGVVSKRANAPYRPGRSEDWLKAKCLHEQEFVIGGFTDPAGSRSDFGALLLGVHNGPEGLTYVGKVGTGFSGASLREIIARMRGLETQSAPFANPPAGAAARGVHWVRPKLVAEVAFNGWTRDGSLRQPSFQGLRDDKLPAEVFREGPGAGLPALTNPGRVLYPEQGLTKRDLARYYEGVAGLILPHVAGRPLAILRCPEGRDKACFYQKRADPSFHESIRSVEIVEKEGKALPYLWIEDVRGLVALVQLGALELHPWGCRVDDIEKPDRMVFDLDPSPEVPWSAVVDAARGLRGRLSDLGVESFVKTTGGKGLHVVAPLTPGPTWAEVKAFSRVVAEAMARGEPELYTTKHHKAARGERIYLDTLRNERGATAVAAFSTRARPGAPVSVPLSWEELTPSVKPGQFTVRNLAKRLAGLPGDPWAGFAELRQKLPLP